MKLLHILLHLYVNFYWIENFTERWPASSPDLLPLGFFLWGHLKTKVYITQPNSLDDLYRRIVLECLAVTPEMWEMCEDWLWNYTSYGFVTTINIDLILRFQQHVANSIETYRGVCTQSYIPKVFDVLVTKLISWACIPFCIKPTARFR